MNIGTKINELRTSKGYSLKNLADLVGVSKSAIQQYENNSTKPSNLVLKEIANIFNVGVWDFYDVRTETYTIESIRFRDGHKLKSMKDEIDNLKHQTADSISRYSELERILSENHNFSSPLDKPIENYNDVERAVKKIRKKWKMGIAPINSIVEFLEQIGIKIVGVNRDNDSPASCGWVNDEPIIILNENPEHNWETTRRRFSLLHEAGHLFFKDLVDDSYEENFCNRFAAAMLLPDEVAVSIIGKNRTSISLGELKRIKETYGISIESTIYRLSDLKLISLDSKRLMIQEYNKWRKNDLDFGFYKNNNESPKRFYDLLRKAITENKIDRYKAFDLSKINIDDLKEKLMVDDKIDLV